MRHAKSIQAKSKKCTVVPVGMAGKAYEVTSPTSGNTYRVYVNPASGIFSCGCDYGHHHPGSAGCSHVVAVFEYIARKQGESTSVFTPDTVGAQHRRRVVDVDGLCVTQRSH
jgi:uncharacterized protein (DUF983 family)